MSFETLTLTEMARGLVGTVLDGSFGARCVGYLGPAARKDPAAAIAALNSDLNALRIVTTSRNWRSEVLDADIGHGTVVATEAALVAAIDNIRSAATTGDPLRLATAIQTARAAIEKA